MASGLAPGRRPTIQDLTGDNHFAQLARQVWLTKSSGKVLPDLISNDIYRPLESEDFAYNSLLLLEQLQCLERYLWPGYNDEDATDQHVLLIALLTVVKRREHLPVWSVFSDRPGEFGAFFRRVLHLCLGPSLHIALRTRLVELVVAAYQSLDSGIVRKQCASLVGIGLWHNLHSDTSRQQELGRASQLQKAWRAAEKRFESSDVEGQARLKFERSWLYSLALEFLDHLYRNSNSMQIKQDDLLFAERVLELLCDLQSQLPTRRYVNTILQDLNIISAIKLSPLYQDEKNGLLRDLAELLQHYTFFPIDDNSGKQFTRQEYEEATNSRISRLQKMALQLHPEKLKLLVLSNFGTLAQRSELAGHLKDLSDAELTEFCEHLGIRTRYPEKSLIVRDRQFLDEIILSSVEARPFFSDKLETLSILPTEQSLFETSQLRTEDYDGTRPLALPKVNLQYLSTSDFLYRSYILYRSEAFYEIRKHLQDTIKRLEPRLDTRNNLTRFDGFSRMAIPISKPSVIEVLPPRVGEEVPAEVKAEVVLDVSRLQPGLRREWETLHEGDTVFLLAIHAENTGQKKPANGHASAEKSYNPLKTVRCAEVISVLDENGRIMRRDQDTRDHIDGLARARQRRLLVRLDAGVYKHDKHRADAAKSDVYDNVNLIVRRKQRENNFKPVLESIKQLTVSDAPLPKWFEEVFLGFGDPASASYNRLSTRIHSVDYRDTFVDWQHLVESLSGKILEPDASHDSSFPPPYILETTEPQPAPPPTKKASKKRRHDQPDGPDPAPTTPEVVKVSTYSPANNGPYPTDAPKTNKVRFTTKQIESITSGVQPGLTLVIGPPGTGKTDTVTQVISNIYHDFPKERTLLIAHSNQALNQLFLKIAQLDIDERHLLRLGHGEEDLATAVSFSKAGRVESLLQRGSILLAEVQRLAESVGAPGAHGSSCETAEYFQKVYIEPNWHRFWDFVGNNPQVGAEELAAAFPFRVFFANAPQPLFPTDGDRDVALEVVKGCERHIARVFTELADIRPFEILRSARDKSNYLLAKEARIVAMTATHAAMRRQEIATLGFKYDNIVMEEAAQVTEIENFIPLVLQQPRQSSRHISKLENPLKRIVLVGDHLQNSPVIQNAAYRDYANLQQSLFQRLMRLGVPHTVLDAQGRARPSIASLYKWRYPALTNLPITSTALEFQIANAGLRFEYQFINVEDYKGRGETEPTPHFLQNLGEAEYAVALYQYMRLLGYPAEKITILTTYAGQRALIRDVLAHRCKNNRLFGLPGWVGTVDKYQGEQNDYVILSLVRTRGLGYLRDLRRLTVALSRARLGLYLLGRREVFEQASLEVREAFGQFFSSGRSDQLEVVLGETLGNVQRGVSDDVEGAVKLEGVEHIGQYVFEMTKAKMEAVQRGGDLLPPAAGRVEEAARGEDEDAEDDGEEANEISGDVMDEEG
ncbi:P-loop containing nucleoside triphosphate hydrolase protein [Polychaeton citri CBS 116435]|uniref:Pre-mRNA-splicing factor n=1 Tax=Polychaeton citri CBS 116435 TaxID=1314669 RepID=A0A9P4US25_9PEZI|nr:P-loop containing nucleoside triphosphate hydrolase protein [Polychaeton citri CBS 116435]